MDVNPLCGVVDDVPILLPASGSIVENDCDDSGRDWTKSSNCVLFSEILLCSLRHCLRWRFLAASVVNTFRHNSQLYSDTVSNCPWSLVSQSLLPPHSWSEIVDDCGVGVITSLAGVRVKLVDSIREGF